MKIQKNCSSLALGIFCQTHVEGPCLVLTETFKSLVLIKRHCQKTYITNEENCSEVCSNQALAMDHIKDSVTDRQTNGIQCLQSF